MKAQDILRDNEFKEAIQLLKPSKEEKNWKKLKDEYDGKHEILNKKDKLITKKKETGMMGQKKEISEIQETVTLSKLVVPWQKKIVRIAVAFLFGKPVSLINSSGDNYEEAFNIFQRTWKDMKLNWHNIKLARTVAIETEAAELFYWKESEKRGFLKKLFNIDPRYELRVKLISNGNNDTFFPHFDDNGTMDAFIRQYTQVEYNSVTKKNDTVSKVDIYTDTLIYNAVQKNGDYEVSKKANSIGKIPVIYYSQENAEWEDVQTLIDKYEDRISKLSDSNDYHADPALVLEGDVVNMPQKGEVGKVLQMKTGGKASYLAYVGAPEAVKLELGTLKDNIYSMTSTPDIDFSNLKGIGNVSGIALKLMFLDAILKALSKQELYGEMFERRINIIKAFLKKNVSKFESSFDEMEIEVGFNDVLPDTTQELIEMLTTAAGGEKIMSSQTAMEKNPLVDNPTEEADRMKAESVNSFQETFKI